MSRFHRDATVFRFQLRAGVRVAIRTLAPLVAGVAAGSVMYGTPMVVVGLFRSLFFSPDVSIACATFAVAAGLAVSVVAAPRLTTGLTGWGRHLPASGLEFRRAATAGIVVVQLPVLALVVVGGLQALVEHSPTAAPRMVAMAPVAWATSLAALRVEREWTRALAIVAALTAWIGTWPGLLAGIALVAAADWRAGALSSKPGRTARGRRYGGGASDAVSAIPTFAATRMWWKVTRRALGWRMAAGTLLGILALVPIVFFLRNNELTELQHSIALRWAILIAIVLVMASVADGLVKRRPPWPWIRSLPWPAARRVGLDASLLVGHCIPVLALAAFLDAWAVLVVTGSVPLIALRGAAAIRQAPGRLSGASGQLIIEGVVVAILVALLPWSSLFLLALTPVGARYAAETEKRREISRWHELHHLAAGDPMSWSDA